jgi:RNA polymerase sigma factor (sigma-70 family)
MYENVRRVRAAPEGDASFPSEDRLSAAEAGPAEPICLETLYRQESPRLLRSLTRSTASREDARDLVHEIFYRIARLGAAGGLRLDRPEAYLSRMAANLLRDRAKTAARHRTDHHVPADEQMLAGPHPERLLESRDMLTRLEAAMLKLRPKTREIFMAHRVHGLSYAEIAERTGLSVKGVEKQMSKAIAHIDRMLDRN